MESPTANVLEVSRERIANQNQSLPTLLEVRQTSSQDCFHLESSSGITGAVIFVILLVLLIWMICVRATRVKKPEKHGLGKKRKLQNIWSNSLLFSNSTYLHYISLLLGWWMIHTEIQI